MTADQILSLDREKKGICDAYAKRIFFANIGIPENGVAHVVVLGWNDERREEKVRILREQGFKYHGDLKAWYSRCPAVGVKSCRIDFNEMVEKGWDGLFHFQNMAHLMIVERYKAENEPAEADAGFCGEIGSRLRLTLTPNGSTKVRSNSDFGDFTVLYFKDDDGRRYSWFQRNYTEETLQLFMKASKVKKVEVAGTVKNHKTRIGIRFTELAKCEITANGNLLHDFAEARRAKQELQDGHGKPRLSRTRKDAE